MVWSCVYCICLEEVQSLIEIISVVVAHGLLQQRDLSKEFFIAYNFILGL